MIPTDYNVRARVRRAYECSLYVGMHGQKTDYNVRVRMNALFILGMHGQKTDFNMLVRVRPAYECSFYVEHAWVEDGLQRAGRVKRV
jgi:hypothetical protein